MSLINIFKKNKNFLELFSQGISVFDSKLKLIACNKKYIQLLDFPDHFSSPGTSLEAFFRFNAERGEYGTDTDIEKLVSQRIELAKASKAHTFERERPDGTILLIQGAPIPEGGFLSTYSDISDLKHIERNLRLDKSFLEEKVKTRTHELLEKEKLQYELLQVTVETVSHGITLFDRELNLVVCNSEFLKIMDFPDDLKKTGTHFEEFIKYNYSRGEYGEGNRAKVVKEIINRTLKFEPHSFRRTRPNGTVIEIIGKPVSQGFVTTYRDVTNEQKTHDDLEADRQLLRQEVEIKRNELKTTNEILQNILNSIPIRVFWKDTDLNYMGANNLFLEDVNCASITDLVGKSDHDLLWSQEANKFRSDDRYVIKNNHSKLNIEECLVMDNGKKNWLRTNKVPLCDNVNNVIGVLGTYEDITKRKNDQTALIASEARFRALFDKTFQFIGLLDKEGIILELNETVVRKFTVNVDEVIGRPFADTGFWTHDASQHEQIKDAVVRARRGEFVRFNATHLTPKGDTVHVDFSLKPVYDRNNELLFLLPEGRDITDKVQAIRESFKTQQWLKAHFDHTPLAVIQWDLDFCVVDWNAAAERIFGYSKDEMLGQHLNLLVKKEDEEVVNRSCISLSNGQANYRNGRENLVKGNHVICTNWYNTPLMDKDNAVYGFVSFVDDVTEVVQSQKELEKSEQRYKLALQGINDGIYDWDIVEKRMFFSEMAASILELPESYDKLNDHIFYERLEESEQEPFKKAVVDHFRGKTKVFEHEVCLKTYEGKERWVLCRGMALKNKDGQAYRMSGSISNITRRKRAELEVLRLNENLENRVLERTKELQIANQQISETLNILKHTQNELVQSEKMASLGGLVSGVAHEVNTPIGVGVTATSHLIDEIEQLKKAFEKGTLKKSDFESFFEHAQENANMVLSNLSRAANLVGSFKQVAVDQTSEDKRAINLLEYMNEIHCSLTPKLKKTKVKIELEIDEEINITTYPGSLAQIFTNLIMNSIIHAFPNEEEGTISISGELDGNVLHMLYEDDGCGMSKDIVANIYEPFFTTRRGDGGSGLGMNIVFNLVMQKFNGKIKCISSQGKGSQFLISFPINN